MKINRELFIFLGLLFVINVAAASFFGFGYDKPDDRWKQLSGELTSMNTPRNAAALSNGMNEYGVRSVRVDIIDLQKSFYVVSGRGITFRSQTVDRSFKLTENQVREIMRMLQDGNISSFERFRIWLMIRV